MKKLTKEQLAKLSKEEKLKLIDALEAKKRAKLRARPKFVPNKGQKEVLASKATVRAVFAGNGSGKTTLGVNSALWASLGYNSVLDETSRVPVRGVVVLDKPEKVDQTWLPELRKWYDIDGECVLSKRGKPYITHIQFPNGSEILFMFTEQDPMSFESIELDWAIFDEPPKRSVYVALRRGARKKNSRPWFMIIGTPIAASWLRREIYDPWARGELQDTECFRFSTDVNKDNLAEGYIESFASVLSEKEKAIRLHGEFFDLDGLALAHLFKRETHVIDPFPWPSNWPVIIGLDPHPSKNHTAIMLGVGKDGYLYYIKEMDSKSAPREFAYELKKWYEGYRVQEVICDSLGSTPGTGGDGNMTFINKLNQCGVRARATSFKDKSDEDFIQRIQQVLEIPVEADNFGNKVPKLRIFSQNRRIIHEIENVQWTKHRGEDIYKPKLDISNKDFLASLKYALTAAGHVGGKKPKTKRANAPSPWSGNKKKKIVLY